MKIVITGGHHSSALPVIKKLRQLYPDVQLYWFGHKFSAQGDKNSTLEFHEITALGIPFYHIHAGKFYRTLNLRRLAKIPYGFFQCLGLLSKLKPDAIMSFGGYISVPTVLAGRLLGIPSVTHEQTVVAGWANLLVSKVAKTVLISWQESEKYFPKEKTVFVGLPLRKEIFEVKSSSFVFDKDLPVVYITTGKIGSHIINKVVGECLVDLLGFCNVIHQCGDNSVFSDFDMLGKMWTDVEKGRRLTIDPAPRPGGGGLSEERPAPSQKTHKMGAYYLRKFVLVDEIGEAYQKANIVVSRSGAHTTAELLALKKSCILIPIPWVSHNEQFENAKLLVDAGLGTILPEKNLSSQSLVDSIKTALVKGACEVNQSDNIPKPNILTVPSGQLEPAELIIRELMSVIKKP